MGKPRINGKQHAHTRIMVSLYGDMFPTQDVLSFDYEVADSTGMGRGELVISGALWRLVMAACKRNGRGFLQSEIGIDLTFGEAVNRLEQHKFTLSAGTPDDVRGDPVTLGDVFVTEHRAAAK
jgi:hypothetical protein